MGTKDVIQLLSSIPIGTIIAWVAVFTTIVTAVTTIIIKLYRVFEKTHKIKEENDVFHKIVQEHDRELKKIVEKLSYIQNKLEENERSELKKLRYSIVRAGEEYVSAGSITIRQLKSLEELFEEYHQDKHANGYVTTLMRKVRALPVIGRLDENEDDIL